MRHRLAIDQAAAMRDLPHCACEARADQRLQRAPVRLAEQALDQTGCEGAEIKIEAGSWILKDMGSTNGTYVNDKRINSHDLVDNDNIKLGRINCKYKVKE